MPCVIVVADWPESGLLASAFGGSVSEIFWRFIVC